MHQLSTDLKSSRIGRKLKIDFFRKSKILFGFMISLIDTCNNKRKMNLKRHRDISNSASPVGTEFGCALWRKWPGFS